MPPGEEDQYIPIVSGLDPSYNPLFNLGGGIGIGLNTEPAISAAGGSVAIGQSAHSTASNSIAIGRGAVAQGINSVAIGYGAVAERPEEVVIGNINLTEMAERLDKLSQELQNLQAENAELRDIIRTQHRFKGIVEEIDEQLITDIRRDTTVFRDLSDT